MLLHSGEKPFRCKQCNYSFTQGQHLKEHMFRHTGVKPYACQHCSYSCSHPKGLKYHMLSHTGEKPFLCKQCNYSGKQSRLFKMHMRNHSGEKLNTCNQPEFLSSKEDHLRCFNCKQSNWNMFRIWRGMPFPLMCQFDLFSKFQLANIDVVKTSRFSLIITLRNAQTSYDMSPNFYPRTPRYESFQRPDNKQLRRRKK